MNFDKCMLCGRPLKSKKNKEIGIGSVCAKRLGLHLVGKKVVGKSLFGGLTPAKKPKPIKRFFSLNHLTKPTQSEKVHGDSLCVVNGEFYTASEVRQLSYAAGF